jgi:DDE superfamily endonuclease
VSITAGKKQHTLKNTVLSCPDKFIVFLGRTFSGHNHDYSMLKHEFPPELDWFEDLHVRVDLGYQGIQSDYRGDQIEIPTKKSRKSKKNPNPQLSDAQKAANKALSQVRIFIEHAIGGMKRYTILVHVFRNRKADFEDDAVGICAGLWNLALSY